LFWLLKNLVQIQLGLAPITYYHAPENFLTAFRTNVAGFFILNPFFSTNFSPIGNSPQNDLFADRHGKIVNVWAGKFSALMASGEAFSLGAGPDLALPAMPKSFIG
jgi:hypothetical protein